MAMRDKPTGGVEKLESDKRDYAPPVNQNPTGHPGGEIEVRPGMSMPYRVGSQQDENDASMQAYKLYENDKVNEAAHFNR